MAKIKRKVIDVSHHQGKIDWAKVKAARIDGVIIRVADGTKVMDRQCDRNIKECERLGIPFGLYIYSRAKTKKQARKEANIILKISHQEKINFSFPLCSEEPCRTQRVSCLPVETFRGLKTKQLITLPTHFRFTHHPSCFFLGQLAEMSGTALSPLSPIV